jgi:peptidyl-dipeptidase Dcp
MPMSTPLLPRLFKASLAASAATGLLLAGFAAEPAAGPTSMIANPLLAPSALPYELPPFELIKDEHFVPAFEIGMAEELREVDAVATNSAAPTFDNTIVALEPSAPSASSPAP